MISDKLLSQIAAIMGKRGGKKNKGRTSEKRKIASRLNGMKGGRPKKNKDNSNITSQVNP